MASHSDTLVVFFGATAGANGGKLGSDERELILLVWQIVDLHEKKVRTFPDLFVRYTVSYVRIQCVCGNVVSSCSGSNYVLTSKQTACFPKLVENKAYRVYRVIIFSIIFIFSLFFNLRFIIHLFFN